MAPAESPEALDAALPTARGESTEASADAQSAPPAEAADAANAMPSEVPAETVDQAGPSRADAAAALADAVATARAPVFLSDAARRVANWVTASGDNDGRPFAIVDKLGAAVFVFTAAGKLRGGAPALVGLAQGDDSVPGIGDRRLSKIRPRERTTPAGRFVAAFSRAPGQRNVLWVDYATAISMHPVVTKNPKERRLERIQSPSAEDKRITFGCINVPAQFYYKVVSPAFRRHGGIVYILPDTRPLEEVFPGVRESEGASPAMTAEAKEADGAASDEIITLSHLSDDPAEATPSAP
jgi:hypothetical protein